MTHTHWSESELLEQTLEGGQAFHGRCAECDARRAELQSFLQRTRHALEQPADAGANALAERILAQTTREDLSVRHDWVLLTRFVTRRFRASRVLRVAAASLLLHLVAVPVLAYYALMAPDPEPFHLSVESLQELPFDDPAPEESGEVSWDEAAELPDATQFSALDLNTSNALNWARYSLRQGAPSGDLACGHPVTEALRERARRIMGGMNEAPRQRSAEGDVGAVLQVLRVEMMLDRYVVHGRSDGLEAALAGLADSSSEGSVRTLEELCLQRAQAYGLGTRLADQEALAASLAPGAPLAREWVLALERALPGVLAGDETGRAWLAWNPGGE